MCLGRRRHRSAPVQPSNDAEERAARRLPALSDQRRGSASKKGDHMERRTRKDGAFARSTRMPGGAATVLAIAVLITLPLAAAPRFSDWSTPQNLGPPVSSPFADLGPCISKDGLSLYFASNRSGNFDIWVSQRASEDSPWEEPMPLPRNPPINTAALEKHTHAVPRRALALLQQRPHRRRIRRGRHLGILSLRQAR